MLVEYVSLLLEIFKKEEKKIKDVSEYLIRFIDNSKICLVLHELDKILIDHNNCNNQEYLVFILNHQLFNDKLS